MQGLSGRASDRLPAVAGLTPVERASPGAACRLPHWWGDLVGLVPQVPPSELGRSRGRQCQLYGVHRLQIWTAPPLQMAEAHVRHPVSPTHHLSLLMYWSTLISGQVLC